ncbi:MAG: response regulator transcription factor [Bacteroidales bacterium]|jgi:DNA-binding CsgD family transcriptional regulator
MIIKDDFLIKENEIKYIPDEYYAPINIYVQFLDAFAHSTGQSIYVIDHYKKNFIYISVDPLFLCGKSAKEVLNMGFEFYLNYVPESSFRLLQKINRAKFVFAKDIPPEKILEYNLNFDFHIKQTKYRNLLINHKIMPLCLANDGKIWLELCVVSLSSHLNIGNIKIIQQGCYNMIWKYNLEKHYWIKSDGVALKDYEKKVLFLSGQGYTIKEISERMLKSIDTIKGYRRQIFKKLNVKNITEAVKKAIDDKII